ncbi:hypothetical protein HMPREF0971_00515 [Segatella oris F0302]|uniref:Uncharacterized protein n=1 Tax=Segatella oris F0302 TaxID=649760 RepID=D1QNH9_9BACT|nr:hypothetical protein HMPREF0971_00515 [Segatella oris F0302]
MPLNYNIPGSGSNRVGSGRAIKYDLASMSGLHQKGLILNRDL